MIAALASAAILATSVGPGPVHASVPAGAYSASAAAAPSTRTGTITVSLRSHGHVVAGAHVQLTVSMLDMNMGSFTLPLARLRPGIYGRAEPILGMGGRWKWTIVLRPPGRNGFTVTIVDLMSS